MDFSERLDALQQRVAEAKATAKTAATESREQIGKRIDQTQVGIARAMQNAQKQAEQTAGDARSKWAELRDDAAAKVDDARAKIEQRTRQHDAKSAARDAADADADAADAIDFAAWAVDNAELAILDAIDAHIHADELARAAGS